MKIKVRSDTTQSKDLQAYVGLSKSTSRGMRSSDVEVAIKYTPDWTSDASVEMPESLVVVRMVPMDVGAKAEIEDEYGTRNSADRVTSPSIQEQRDDGASDRSLARATPNHQALHRREIGQNNRS